MKDILPSFHRGAKCSFHSGHSSLISYICLLDVISDELYLSFSFMYYTSFLSLSLDVGSFYSSPLIYRCHANLSILLTIIKSVCSLASLITRLHTCLRACLLAFFSMHTSLLVSSPLNQPSRALIQSRSRFCTH